MSTLSDNIKAIRNNLNLTQADFAKELSYKSNVVISGWESGTREPSAQDLVKIAELGKVTLDWLLTGQVQINQEGNFPNVKAKKSMVGNFSNNGDISYNRQEKQTNTEGDMLINALNRIIEMKDKEIERQENRIIELEAEIAELKKVK